MTFSITERLAGKATQLVGSRIRVAPSTLKLARGTLSVTFDDFPKSAWEVAGRILNDYQAQATYFVSGSCNGGMFYGVQQYDLADLSSISAAGHEIGCHTFEHIAASRCKAETYLNSIDRNWQFLSAQGLTQAPTSFAYTYGRAPLLRRRRLADRFYACRTALPGLNGPTLDRSLLRAVGLEQWRKRHGDPIALIRRLIKQASQQRCWLIVFTHDVSDKPSPFGCHTTEFTSMLSCAREAGLDILPINQVLGPYSAQPTMMSKLASSCSTSFDRPKLSEVTN